MTTNKITDETEMTFKHFLLSLVSELLLISSHNVAAEKILRYTDHEPYGGMRTQIIKEIFFAEIEKESQGRLKIEPHWNGETAISYDALAWSCLSVGNE